ncbi:MAG TPA: M67 family metallopeptidase [Thermoplasmata archaeon]|nr:M67 family metallopeptidase [Thermoplasmata archaeon]
MKEVVMSEAFLSEMKAHARETYPDECCGFLIGSPPETDGERRRTISALERARNEFDGERRRRFLILPAELREVERRTEQSERAVVGFYHSHPDHPAQPSQYDQDHAWPWYSYLVLAVTAADVPSVAAFELDPDTSTFHETSLVVVPDSVSLPSVTSGLPRA